MGPRAGVCLCVIAAAIGGCGDGAPPPTGVPTDAAVDSAARWCPEDAGERGFATEELIGLSLPDAERSAQEGQCSVRVVERDGESLPVTLDFNPTRINVAVEDGLVTEIKSLG